MKAWTIDRLGGTLRYTDVPTPQVRPGSVLVRTEAQSLMSYLKPYLEGKLSAYRAPEDFIPGGNAIGVVESVGADVWHLKQGDRVVVSPHIVSDENVTDPAQILLGVTSMGGAGDSVQASWKDGTLAEYVLVPSNAVTPLTGLAQYDAGQLAAITRLVVPYGGLVRGRLAAGETVVINGATGAYGSAAAIVALAMGAARVVAAGRNESALKALKTIGGERLVPVVLTGDVGADTTNLREAAAGGAHLAFDMVGGAQDANSTISALGSLHRGGRLVLMGSSAVPLPINYLQVMFHNLEIIGNFMYSQRAYLPLLDLVRAGLLDLSVFAPKAFPMSELSEAMEFAGKAKSLEIAVLHSDGTGEA